MQSIQSESRVPAESVMQTIHKVCLILTGICVIIICVGIGLGISYIGRSYSNDTIVEYEAYDEDYVDYGDSSTVNTSDVTPVQRVNYGSIGGDRGVIETKHQEEVITDGYISHSNFNTNVQEYN